MQKFENKHQKHFPVKSKRRSISSNYQSKCTQEQNISFDNPQISNMFSDNKIPLNKKSNYQRGNSVSTSRFTLNPKQQCSNENSAVKNDIVQSIIFNNINQNEVNIDSERKFNKQDSLRKKDIDSLLISNNLTADFFNQSTLRNKKSESTPYMINLKASDQKIFKINSINTTLYDSPESYFKIQTLEDSIKNTETYQNSPFKFIDQTNEINDQLLLVNSQINDKKQEALARKNKPDTTTDEEKEFIDLVKKLDEKAIFEKLQERRFLCNSRDHHGSTAIHWAVKRSNIPIIEMQTQAGAVLGVIDELNRKPVDIARRNGDVKVYYFLRSLMNIKSAHVNLKLFENNDKGHVILSDNNIIAT